MIVFLLFTACSSAQAPAAETVETYLQRLADKDETRLVTLTCPSYEMDALLEFDSFALVKTTLKGLACQQTALQENQATVVCQGSIEAAYGNEIRSFDLSQRTYTVIQSGGEWLVCGYTK